jgi:hypothetical protein
MAAAQRAHLEYATNGMAEDIAAKVRQAPAAALTINGRQIRIPSASTLWRFGILAAVVWSAWFGRLKKPDALEILRLLASTDPHAAAMARAYYGGTNGVARVP